MTSLSLLAGRTVSQRTVDIIQTKLQVECLFPVRVFNLFLYNKKRNEMMSCVLSSSLVKNAYLMSGECGIHEICTFFFHYSIG